MITGKVAVRRERVMRLSLADVCPEIQDVSLEGSLVYRRTFVSETESIKK